MISYQVGHFYEVPVFPLGQKMLLPGGDTVTVHFLDFKKDLPLLTLPSADEPEVTEKFKQHVHIDWRFLNDQDFKFFFVKFGKDIAQQVLTLDSLFESYTGAWIEKQIKFKSLLCYRLAPHVPDFSEAPWMRMLEDKMACAKLTTHCPHKGVAKTAMIDEGDTLLCPAHGLRWCKITGKNVPYRLL